jgi:hypothetical protein
MMKYQLSDGVERLPEKIRNADTVYIFASGPSLRNIEDRVSKLRNKGLIIASPTTVPWLYAHGLYPHWILSSDSQERQYHDCARVGANRFSSLIAPQSVHPSLPKYFGHKTFWFKSLIQGEDGSIDSVEYSRIVNDLLSNIDVFAVQAGCVTNQAIIISLFLMQKNLIKAKRVCLVGADYAYSGGFDRVPIYELVYEENGWLPTREYRKVERPYGGRIVGYVQPPKERDGIEWEGYQTNSRMVLYKRSFIILWISTHMNIVTCSDGILHEVQHVEFDDILEGEFPEKLTDEEIDTRGLHFLHDVFPKDMGLIA